MVPLILGNSYVGRKENWVRRLCRGQGRCLRALGTVGMNRSPRRPFELNSLKGGYIGGYMGDYYGAY